jgi:hypothetical protein
MPVHVELQYHRNVNDAEKKLLEKHRAHILEELPQCNIFDGRVQWVAMQESESNRTVFVLNWLTTTPKCLAYTTQIQLEKRNENDSIIWQEYPTPKNLTER